MKNRVEDGWRAFEAHVLSPTVGDVQRQEMRRAFFAGAFVIMDTLAEAMSDGDDMSEGDERVMIDLALEREMYLAALKAGRA
jgi:hypothetical protein